LPFLVFWIVPVVLIGTVSYIQQGQFPFLAAFHGFGVWFIGRDRLARIFAGTIKRSAETSKHHPYRRFMVYLASEFRINCFQYDFSWCFVWVHGESAKSVKPIHYWL
jgi:hypothetical protein